MNRNRSTVVFFSILAALMILVVALGANTIRSAADVMTENSVKFYESLEIRPEDSLWSISRKYASRYGCSVTDYVDTLKKLNGLNSSQIVSGGQLIVVYYR